MNVSKKQQLEIDNDTVEEIKKRSRKGEDPLYELTEEDTWTLINLLKHYERKKDTKSLQIAWVITNTFQSTIGEDTAELLAYHLNVTTFYNPSIKSTLQASLMRMKGF